MEKVKLIISRLKPKVKAFGFNQKELKGIAAQIANNLTLEEDASDEDANATIDTAIEAVLPVLEFGRSYANRVINDTKRNDTEDNEDDDNDGETPATKSSKNKSPKPKSEETMPEWAKALLESNKLLQTELSAIKGEKITDTRRGKLEKLLKDTGTFGTRTLKSFAKMKFDNDEEFEEFYSEVESDLKSFNQERANAGLSALGIPGAGSGQNKKEEKTQVLTEDEIKAIAQS